MPYRFLKRQFYGGCCWLWYLQAALYIGVIYFYFTIPGEELVYAIYIPLDVLLTISLGVFYYATYLAEKKRAMQEEQMKDLVKEKLATGLAGLMKGAAHEDSDAIHEAKYEAQ